MSVSVTTIKTATEIKVKSPYNRRFVDEAKNLGGKWAAPYWVFDIRDEARVRGLCLHHYCEDGASPVEKVTIRASFPKGAYAGRDAITVGGRYVATATGRDSGAKLGTGVVLLSGKFRSGGSVKNWATVADEGTEVLIRDVPRIIADRLMAPGGLDAERAGAVSVEPEDPVIDVEALQAEREKLMARINEIDSLLNPNQ